MVTSGMHGVLTRCTGTISRCIKHMYAMINDNNIELGPEKFEARTIELVQK